MGPIPSNAPACFKTYRNFRPANTENYTFCFFGPQIAAVEEPDGCVGLNTSGSSSFSNFQWFKLRLSLSYSVSSAVLRTVVTVELTELPALLLLLYPVLRARSFFCSVRIRTVGLINAGNYGIQRVDFLTVAYRSLQCFFPVGYHSNRRSFTLKWFTHRQALPSEQ